MVLPFLAAALPILSGALSIAGGLKGSKASTQHTSSIQGLAALPQVVQDAYLKQYLPAAQQQFQNGPSTGPMGRADTGKYSSRGLQELQQYADQLAEQRGKNPPPPPSQVQQQASNPDSAAIIDRLFGNNLSSYSNIARYKDRYAHPSEGYDKQAVGPRRSEDLTALKAILTGSGQAQGNPQGQNGNIGQQLGGGFMQGPEGGVRPLGVVEPFNELQTNVFDQLAQGHNSQGIESFVNPYASQGLDALSGSLGQGQNLGQQLGGYLGALGAPQGGQQGQGLGIPGLESYMNPYTQNVINTTLQRMQQQLAGGENSILGSNSRLGSLGAFGSSALGTMLGNRQNEALQRAQEFIAGQNQANYGQAQQQRNTEIDRALGQRNSDLQNLIHGGNQSYQLAGGLQDVGFNQQNQSLQNMLQAGNQIQQQGQNDLNAANPLIQQQLPQNRLAQFGQNLAQIPGSGQSFNYAPPQQNILTRLGNAGIGASGLLQGYQQATQPGIGGIASLGGRI